MKTPTPSTAVPMISMNSRKFSINTILAGKRGGFQCFRMVSGNLPGGSAGKPGRCFASVTAPKTMPDHSPKAQIPQEIRELSERVEDNAFHLCAIAQAQRTRLRSFLCG